MFKYCLFAAALFCSIHVQATDWLADYHQQISQQAKKHKVPGFAWVFVDKNKQEHIFLNGVTAKNQRAINADTLFRLASVSKTFTAALMAKLVENNQLQWNTPVSTLAPQFNPLSGDPIILQDILGQSSGFMPNAYDNLIEANYDPKRVLQMLAKLKPLCKPGRCYTYQNTLLGSIDQYFEQHDTSYANEIEKRLFLPLGMPHASVGKQALIQSKNWAKPHIAVARNRYRQTKVKDSYYRFAPAAGINASIKDMAIWLKAMLGEYPHVLSPALIERLTRSHIKTKKELYRRHWREHLSDAHYGLGWRVYQFADYPLVYHGGWVQGYRADVAFAPTQGVGFAMLTNAETNLINQFTADFWSHYFSLWRAQSGASDASE